MSTPSWKVGGEGWLSALAAAEASHGLPVDLLARMAFQECSWRQGVIDGTIVSPAGALGILQLMPRFFTTVRVPVPFASTDTLLQIAEAVTLLAALHRTFNDWQVALAAYNWGQGDVEHAYAMDADQYELKDMPTETRNYVTQICADVPVTGVLLA